MKVLMVGVLGLGLLAGGCSVKSPFEGPSEYMASSLANDSNMVQECREWVRERETYKWSHYEKLEPEAKAYALMHQETMDMIKVTFGKGSEDPCSPGTNVWDAYVAYAEQQGETSREAWKSGASIIKHGLTVGGIAYGVGEIMDAVGTTTTTHVGGDDNSIGRDKYDTRAYGEGGVNSTGSTSTEATTTTTTTTRESAEDSFNTDSSGF